MIAALLAALLLPARLRAADVDAVPSIEFPAAAAFSAPQLPAVEMALPPALPELAQPALPGLEPAQAAAPDGLQQLGQTAAPAPAAQGANASGFAAHAAGEARFDGARSFSGQASGAPVEAAPASSGWTEGSFEASDGAPIAFKSRPGDPTLPARVYSGGLALNESFESYFATQHPANPQFFLWTRANPPSGWKPTSSMLDADARDLARMIVRAKKSTRTGKVELALHSFGNLVFQRMVQLRGEPEAAEALEALRGSRVALVNAISHYEGPDYHPVPELEQRSFLLRATVDWLDLGDKNAARWEELARANPLLEPSIRLGLAEYRAQRGAFLSLATQEAASMMLKDLAQPWAPEIDSIRKGFIAEVQRNARDQAWQEALLRRSNESFLMNMTKDDAGFLRRLGLRLDIVQASRDQLIDWGAFRMLCEWLGVRAPEKPAAPGTVLSDRAGRFRARIVDADHYFPLKRPAALAAILDGK